MPRQILTALVLVIAIVQAGCVHRGLSWKQQALDLPAKFDQQDVSADFEFTNESDHPVTVTGLDTTCSCTLAALEKRTYAPGESGRINVMFEVGDQTGLQREYIIVATDEAHTDPTRLQIQVQIPEYLKIEPRMVLWAVGSEPSERVITCTAQAERPIRLAGAQSSNPAITAQVETISPGIKYRIHLKPISTARHIAATISLPADVTGTGLHVFNVYAYITGP